MTPNQSPLGFKTRWKFLLTLGFYAALSGASRIIPLERETDSGELTNNKIIYKRETEYSADENSYNGSGTINQEYYKTTFVTGKDAQKYWLKFDSLDEEQVNEIELLSGSYRRAITHNLTFEFPFYGHMIRSIIIATGGFIFTGYQTHNHLAATQYIAPLMSDFDMSISKDTTIKYIDKGNSFTVLWDKVILGEQQEAGSFTFQATIHNTGDIIFSYKDIPLSVKMISDDSHPLKIGVADAYLTERTIFGVQRKTIYEYHRIDLKDRYEIRNWTSIILHPLPTCLSLKTCESCLSNDIDIKCSWCNKIKRCSNGIDRYRQQWQENGCNTQGVSEFERCAGVVYSVPNSTDESSFDKNDGFVLGSYDPSDERQRNEVVAELSLLGLLIGFLGWLCYINF